MTNQCRRKYGGIFCHYVHYKLAVSNDDKSLILWLYLSYMIRIQKYLSEQGICSRREAEEFIKQGLVKLNGEIVREFGVKVDPEKDKVGLVSRGQKMIESKTTIVYNKPKEVVCSRDSSEGTTIFDLLPEFRNLNIVGRLDKDSEGLILLSDDGMITKTVTGDKHITEKEYMVGVREVIPSRMKQLFEKGIELEDGMTLPAKVSIIGPHIFRIMIREGRNHQIRRMCEYMHLTVVKLKRLRVGHIVLGDLKVGEYRLLDKDEVKGFK